MLCVSCASELMIARVLVESESEDGPWSRGTPGTKPWIMRISLSTAGGSTMCFKEDGSLS